jgi:hypothetical protein
MVVYDLKARRLEGWWNFPRGMPMTHEDKPESEAIPEAANAGQAAAQMTYEGNPKHKEPWQRGRKGSLCPKNLGASPADLLTNSVLDGDKRYACHDGKAYCAQEHAPGRWHGFPVGWVEVPPRVAAQMVKDGKLSKRDRRRYWEGHE